jgi:hypothetical protein
VNGTMTAHATDSGILGDSITNSTQPILVGQATAGTSVEIWDTFNSVTSKLTTVTADSTGAWSANLLAQAQAQGVHSYVAKQLNADLSVASTSAATALTIDTTAPSAPSAPVLAAGSDTGTSSGDNITSKNTPTLSGTADANAWVSVYQEGRLIGKAKALANGSWSFTVAKALADVHADPALAPGYVPPQRLVYVSCNPATLARDAEVLTQYGSYRCSATGMVNMFPHTAHVESMTVFDLN